jgi:hypothetical protein
MCVCVYAHACPFAFSTFEQVDQFSQSVVQTLHYCRLPKLKPFNVIHLMVAVWQTHELVRWVLHYPHLIVRDGRHSYRSM